MEIANELLKDVLYVVLTVILPICVKYGIKWIDEIVETNKNTKENEMIQDALEIVENIVISVNQTFTNELKAKGEFTKENGVSAYNKARIQALELISEETQKLIKEKYSDVERWLKVQIESYVNQYKVEYEYE